MYGADLPGTVKILLLLWKIFANIAPNFSFMETISLQAEIALDAILWSYGYNSGSEKPDTCFREWILEEKEYAPLEGLSAGELVTLIGKATSLLKEKGYEFTAPRKGAKQGKTLYITKDCRVFLDPRGEIELPLTPSMRAVLIFFLKHPEGIASYDIGKYRKEIEEYYLDFSSFSDLEKVKEVVDRIVDPDSRSMTVLVSKISAVLSKYLDSSVLGEYLIKNSEKKRTIRLDRSRVLWDVDFGHKRMNDKGDPE